VGAAGPAWLAAAPRQVAAGLGALALAGVPPGALAQLATRPVQAAGVLALSALPAAEGRATLMLPTRPARAPRLPWPDRFLAAPRARGARCVALCASPLWPRLRDGLPATAWRGEHDAWCPRHELLEPLGVPGGSSGGGLAVWEAEPPRPARAATSRVTRAGLARG